MADQPQPNYEDVQFTVSADGPWVVISLGRHGTIRVKPAQAISMGRSLKVAALMVRGKGRKR